MADIKWSAFPSTVSPGAGDVLVGLHSGANTKFTGLTIPFSPTVGGTGVANAVGKTITLGAALTTSGAFASTFTMTGVTTVTFPTSGTLQTTAGASGIVNSGLINQLGYYAGAGTTISGLATGNSGTLITSAGGVPSISSTLPATVQGNITALGTIAQNLTLSSPTAAVYRYIITSGNNDGVLRLQNGLGSAAFGGGYALFGSTHATFPGWTKAAISAQLGSKFAINNSGLADASDVFTCDRSGNVVANGSVTTTQAIISKVNGTESANAVTASGGAGYITTSALTTAGAGSYAITWTNTFITATSVIQLQVMGGTNTTQNISFTVTAGSGTSTLTIYNNTAATALNGTILIGYSLS
jgi:hypothetical protein